jgi:hypothetical protein
LNVNDHALAIDVADFQVCQFSASYSGGLERHQQSAMIRSQSCVDESRDFFPAEDRRKVKRSFRVGRLGDNIPITSTLFTSTHPKRPPPGGFVQVGFWGVIAIAPIDGPNPKLSITL